MAVLLHRVSLSRCILAMSIGVLLGTLGWQFFGHTFTWQWSCLYPYMYINPRLRCHSDENIQKKEYEVFQEEVSQFLDRERQQGTITDAAVYFRDLEAGPWFGINEREPFSPASLLKVPLMMTYLRIAQDSPDILTTKMIPKSQFQSEPQLIPVADPLDAGQEYTVEDLLRRMIAYSDNQSMVFLGSYLTATSRGTDTLAETFIDLGIIDVPEDIRDFLSVKTYASLFRLLYNATFLNREMSNKALNFLRQSQFGEGLVAGIPSGIAVAHKFGERVQDAGHKQLHDCGIVYYPENHYILCIMTKGRDTHALASVIRRISEMVYEEVRMRAEL